MEFFISDFIQTKTQGFLNKYQFVVKSLDNSSVTSNLHKRFNSKLALPSSVLVQASINGTLLNFTLVQIQGIMNTAALSNKVYQMRNSQVELMQGSNLV